MNLNKRGLVWKQVFEFFFQRYIFLNILVPCTVTGKEDVNKCTGKGISLPAQVLWCTIAVTAQHLLPSFLMHNSAKGDETGRLCSGCPCSTSREPKSPHTPWAGWEISCGHCRRLMEMETPASAIPAHPSPGHKVLLLLLHLLTGAETWGAQYLLEKPGISQNQYLIWGVFACLFRGGFVCWVCYFFLVSLCLKDFCFLSEIYTVHSGITHFSPNRSEHHGCGSIFRHASGLHAAVVSWKWGL